MKKPITNLLAIFGGLTIIYLLLSAFTPISIFEWKFSEDQRKLSPNGRFEAVLFRGSAGAMSGYSYEIYVVEKGKVIDRELDFRRRVYQSYENPGKFSYEWRGRDLHIEIEETPIDGFWPYYFSEADNEYKTRVREGRVYLTFNRD